MANEQITGTRDEHYDLVNILYHALHGAWNYDQYIADAESNGDDELADFYRQVKQENAARADEAKRLLAARLT